MALAVDRVTGVETRRDESTVSANEITLPGLKYVAGVLKHPDGLIFIHDLESFLSAEEEAALDVTLSQP